MIFFFFSESHLNKVTAAPTQWLTAKCKVGVKFSKIFYYLGLRTAHVVDTYEAEDLHLV